MKKFIAIGLAAALSLTLLAGCGQNDDKNNTAPAIEGVPETATIMAGEEWDALEGVTATDAEDGDITSKIEVTADGLEFVNGKTTPTDPNYAGYEVIYSVKDSGGLEAVLQYCTLVVNEAAAPLEKVFEADFSQAPEVPAEKEAEARHYWELAKSDQGDATVSLKKGALVVDVANGGEHAYNVLLKRGFGDFEAVKYRVVAWVDSSAATTIKAKASVSDSEYFEEKDVTLTEGYQKVEVSFDLTAAGQAWFEFHLGGEGKNGYSLSFIKIDIYKVIGSGADETLFENAFTANATGISGNDKATVSFNNNETHVAVSYDDGTDHDWYSKATVALDNLAITKGTQYKLSFTLKATNKLQANVCVEDNEKEWEVRAFFEKVEVNAGEEKTFTLTLDWHDGGWQTVESGKAVIRFYFGLHDADQNNGTNDVVVKNVKLVLPGQTERKAHDNFLLFGGSSFNKKNTELPYDLFSGSDDENGSAAGVSTAYIEGGKLVYKVYEGGTKPENHKLVIGFNGSEWDDTAQDNVPFENSIVLPENAYYIISFKIKASVELDFNLTLHDFNNQGGGTWDDGLLLRRANFNNPADPVHIGTTEQTFEFTTKLSLAESKCELILEFGSSAIVNGVTIEISELTIGYRAVED